MRKFTAIVMMLALCVTAGTTGRAAGEETYRTAEEYRGENSWRYRDGQRIEIEEGSDAVIRTAEDRVWGIDVSEHNGLIDWEKVKQTGIGFVIIRCGYGTDYEAWDDKRWERNVSECERLGIPYGVYIYSYADNTEEAYSEAQHVLRLIKGHNLSYPVYFDMEELKMLKYDKAALATTFCTAMTNAGYRVGVYSNLDWWTNYLTDPCFEQWERWVAQWSSKCDYKGSYGIWQYSSKGRVDGIDGDVDMNYQVQDNLGFGNPGWEVPFEDVDARAWYWPYVHYINEFGIMTGLDPSHFGVEETLSRAQFAVTLYRMEKNPETEYSETFPDVPEDDFYTIPVVWARNSGRNIIQGYEDGMFGPTDPVTREQIAVMMYRYAGEPAVPAFVEEELNRFQDAGAVSPFAREAMAWAVWRELIQGDKGRLDPQGYTKREVCATILQRYIEEIGLQE